MLFRKASKEIVKWIESGKDALLVAGASRDMDERRNINCEQNKYKLRELKAFLLSQINQISETHYYSAK